MKHSGSQCISELLAAARKGSEEARERLFAACRSYLVIIACHRTATGKNIDQSDVVQQTLLEAHRGFQQFQGKTTPEWLGWLRTMLTRNVIDLLRRSRGRSVSVPFSSFDSKASISPADSSPSPSVRLMAKERELQVADALLLLSEEHQEVIRLRNFDQLPFDEIARRMKRTRPAAQMLWMRAIKHLHKIMEGSASE